MRPRGLPAPVRKVWDGLVERLPGHFLAGDEGLLEQYCRTWVAWRDACDLCEEHGRTFVYSNGNPGRAPWAQDEDNLGKRLQSLAKDLDLPALASQRTLELGTGKVLSLDDFRARASAARP